MRNVRAHLPPALACAPFILSLIACATASAKSDVPAGNMSFHSWRASRGDWQVRDGSYVQRSGTDDCRTFAPAAEWGDYDFSVRARKTGGREGFLVLFRAKDRENFYWLNIGGWGNTKHAIESRPGPRTLAQMRGSIKSNRWYDIKVVLRGESISCYLDGKRIL
ncbi:MAG: hypothetical protein ACYS9X_32540, partial [Planctomycetota bacterium]